MSDVVHMGWLDRITEIHFGGGPILAVECFGPQGTPSASYFFAESPDKLLKEGGSNQEAIIHQTTSVADALSVPSKIKASDPITSQMLASKLAWTFPNPCGFSDVSVFACGFFNLALTGRTIGLFISTGLPAKPWRIRASTYKARTRFPIGSKTDPNQLAGWGKKRPGGLNDIAGVCVAQQTVDDNGDSEHIVIRVSEKLGVTVSKKV